MHPREKLAENAANGGEHCPSTAGVVPSTKGSLGS